LCYCFCVFQERVLLQSLTETSVLLGSLQNFVSMFVLLVSISSYIYSEIASKKKVLLQVFAFFVQYKDLPSISLVSDSKFVSTFLWFRSTCSYDIDCIARNLKILCLFFRWLLALKIISSVSVISMRYFVSKFDSLFSICGYNFDWISPGLKVVLSFLCFSGKSFTSITHRDFGFAWIFPKFCQYVCLVGLYQRQ